MANKTDLDNGGSKSDLRDAAEEKLGMLPVVSHELKDQTTEQIIHELRVHQIELEMQNEELKRVQRALEDSGKEFQDLYDFAPVGYFTLTRKGIIRRVNLTGADLLGIPRSKLIGRGFGRFVATENLDEWDQHIFTVLGHEEAKTCDLKIKRKMARFFMPALEVSEWIRLPNLTR
jgi:PAS domain-containing protein